MKQTRSLPQKACDSEQQCILDNGLKSRQQCVERFNRMRCLHKCENRDSRTCPRSDTHECVAEGYCLPKRRVFTPGFPDIFNLPELPEIPIPELPDPNFQPLPPIAPLPFDQPESFNPPSVPGSNTDPLVLAGGQGFDTNSGTFATNPGFVGGGQSIPLGNGNQQPPTFHQPPTQQHSPAAAQGQQGQFPRPAWQFK